MSSRRHLSLLPDLEFSAVQGSHMTSGGPGVLATALMDGHFLGFDKSMGAFVWRKRSVGM